MVNTRASNKWLQEVTGRQIDDIVDPLRDPTDHAGITDNYELQLREFEKTLSADSEPSQYVAGNALK